MGVKNIMTITKQCIICRKEFNAREDRIKCCSEECSVTNEIQQRRKYQQTKKYKENNKRYRTSITGRIATNKYAKIYRTRSKYKKYMKKYLKEYSPIYKKTPKYKAYAKEYSKTPKAKLSRKKWKQSPVGKLAQKKYNLSDGFKKSRAKWATTPKGKLTRRMLVIQRRARLSKIILNFSKEEWKNKLESTKGFCPGYKRKKHYVGVWNLTLDHIYSVMRAYKDFIQTGIKRIYTIDDVQPLCQQCNSSKHDKPMETI